MTWIFVGVIGLSLPPRIENAPPYVSAMSPLASDRCRIGLSSPDARA
jgi:hypothetical protein